jgi:hypothetical protein
MSAEQCFVSKRNGRYVAGIIPLDWEGDQPQPIPVVHFDFSDLDSITEQGRQALTDASFGEWLMRVMKCREDIIRQETLMQVIGISNEFENEAMAYDLMRDCCGAAAAQGFSSADLARKWKISKEAFQQSRERMRKYLGLRITRTMRSEEAKHNMSLRNFRRLDNKLLEFKS